MAVEVSTKYPNVSILIEWDFSYKVIEVLPSGKKRVRRKKVGRDVKAGQGACYDQYGNKLYFAFKDFEDAKANALNFVNNFLKLSKKYAFEFWYRWGDNEKDQAEGLPEVEAKDEDQAKELLKKWLTVKGPRKYAVGIIWSTLQIKEL